MTAYVPTRHYRDNGPEQGYVYIVLRDDELSVKIGSTLDAPGARLSSTPSCDPDGFLIACRTTAVRELENHLHNYFTELGRKLPGRDNFALTVEDIISLAYWFDGGLFGCAHTGRDEELQLVDKNGELIDTIEAYGEVVGRAAHLTSLAQNYRRHNQERERERLELRLWNKWNIETAWAWRMSEWDFYRLTSESQYASFVERARQQISKGRPARIPSRPAFLEWPRIQTFQESDDGMEWIEAMAAGRTKQKT